MKNILLAISGLTPQILTETLFALTIQQNIKIDEIYIITTKRGKKVIEGKDKSASTPNTSLQSEIKNLCTNYKIKKPKFSVNDNVIAAEEESLELYDVKTDQDNILFPNKTAELVRRLTHDPDTTIYASLSGGRKSMAAHLAIVLSLFARTKDKLFHVLTSEEFEFKNFYPKNQKEAKALIIAEIPFIKLRSLNSPIIKKAESYYEIVEKTQERLQFLADDSKLIIDLKKREILFKERSINLSPIEIVIYLSFIENKISNRAGFINKEIQSIEYAGRIKTILEENFNYYIDSRDKNHWSKKGISQEYFLSLKSKINKKISELFISEEQKDLFKISSNRIWGDTSYLVKAPKDKMGINYE